MKHIPETKLFANTTVQDTGSDIKRGVLLVGLSALAFSTAGIFTKSVAANAWDVIFWRGLSGIAFTLVFLLARAGFKDELRRFDAPALLATILMASGTAAFIPAFKLTSVANVSLIWATSPFVGAIFAWAFIKEIPSARVLTCSVLALVGVAITVHGSFAAGNITGDMLALWMTLMMAGTMVVYRAHPDTPTKLPAALSALILFPFALFASEPAQVSGVEIGVLISFGLVFATASVLLAEGARLIPSAQAALVSALETPLAPIWAILILSEWPSVATIVGGAIIIAAVVFSQIAPRVVNRSCKIRSARSRANTAAFLRLNDHLRLDIGIDDEHSRVKTNWQDPLEIETRRLSQRL
ncbi:DMT family transporter [Parasedimentitalea psychrophila]|uniref:DMT family transporter n=1 Tax=Parasedimentitalea psychrophila TaxID=2997337 RepID=A0A9Y2KV31_9RHOB|nr:DMT family transporter [Parasedimentitalea psychrophila]WIY23705.1 DMT family transporter [Parasedimentitalea psychrophila]